MTKRKPRRRRLLKFAAKHPRKHLHRRRASAGRARTHRTCRCSGYPFPHRKGSGKCRA